MNDDFNSNSDGEFRVQQWETLLYKQGKKKDQCLWLLEV